MIQPRNYPEFIGQSLMLEPEPFVALVDDDNPWIEGLFLTAVAGVLVGIAKLIGGWLLTASLPASASVLEVLMQGLTGSGILGQMADPVAAQAGLRQVINLLFVQSGYGSGALGLLVLILVPISYIGQWLYFGLVGHGIARLMGGTGTLGQSFGAMSLMVAPRILLLLTVIPFVSVGSTLLLVWSTLIVFRALEVSHELGWQQAAIATVILLVGFVLLLMLIGGLVAGGISLWLGGVL
jgi:hypothetical protein